MNPLDLVTKALSFFQPKDNSITSYSPEEQNAILQVRAKDPNTKFTPEQIIDLYHKNGSALWGGQSQPTPTPQHTLFGKAVHFLDNTPSTSTQTSNQPQQNFNPLQKAIQYIAPQHGQVLAESTEKPNLNGDVQNFLEKTVFPITDKYHIPRSVAAGQFAGEGRFNGLGAARNNYYNIGAFDSNPNLAYDYQTPQQGVEQYAKFITGQANNYASPDVQQKFSEAAKQKNAELMLKAIERAGYAGDPNTYRKRAANGNTSYTQFIESTPEYRYYQ